VCAREDIREEEIMEDIRFRMGPIFFRSSLFGLVSFYVYKKWW
jgi:hypothetical protein